MREFKEVAIGTQLKLTSGFPFPSSDFSNEGFPLIRIRDVLTSQTETYYKGLYSPGYIIKKGDILVGMDGEFHVAKWQGVEALLNQRVLKVELHNESLVVLDFLFHWLGPFIKKVNDITAATTVKHLSTKDLTKAKAFLPEIEAQKKIAAILTATDIAIEKTEVLIGKYQQIKAGLMHDLFTRGVLPNGQLRPPREQAAELYQETAIGWIPKEWDLKRCADLCKRICVGIVIQPTQYYVEEGVPAFRSANVREDGIDPINFVYISTTSNQLLAKSQVKAGDIVSVRTGYPGTSAVIPPEFQGANCIDILISTPGEQVSSEYLCDWINSSFGKGQVLRQQGGMAQQHFNVGEMRELLVALPSLDEQMKIRSKINAVASKLATDRVFLQKLRTQRLGLMQDLITGKVPVKVDIPETADA
ncbi:restriction endonuclease subunit S [Pseudomonas koreensis]|uniref:Restriction endonuclease subunit S n=1 Tax=Pseudomonas koreensis TaxID=198620 RepID=A0A9X2XF96_9PSED|nr:restriction endonuclease subunit S [Pseudomonas koreensis]MCU7247885.1 restriction endonuclease subunit S [Pseudomonas koreensis]